MRASARIVAGADGRGGTRLSVLKGEPPLLPRRTEVHTRDAAVVHFVGGAAGPLGGDEWHIDIEVGPGAALVVRTVAATVALPGPAGARSSAHVRAHVATGARLDWLPEPLVAARGCRHEAKSIVELDDGAFLTWREEVVCGRHGEDPGDLGVGLSVTYAGVALCQQHLAIGPGAPGWAGPAVLAGARAAGSLLVVDHEIRTAASGEGWARMPLAGPGVLTCAVAGDAATLRRRLARGQP
jgi:urease accessory protein